MKLASFKHGRDGRLVVVSQDLNWFTDAFLIAPTLQAALDDWDNCGPRLQALAESLEHEGVPRGRFHERDAASPLPRAYQWADGSAYVNHVELVRRARGAEMPESFWTDPLMYQGGSDGFLSPRDPIPLADEAWGCDLEAEIVVVVGDVPQGATREQALAAIRLVGLVNDVSLRNLIPAELAKGFGFVQSKPASALSPVLVTPEALGARWKDGKLHGALSVQLNGKDFGRADAGVDMTFDFGTLIAHLARTRSLSAGTVIGSGTVSNKDADGGPGKPVSEGGLGYSCIAEVRTVETILRGAAETPFLKHGDTVRIEMLDDRHHTIFGAIEQTVAPLSSAG
ncbi:fumarylacetoacetate hydrolase family protein [Brevundimonas sp.]|uniref:fumarylacetoacetate hydrolase family protein n=1 Tax=Brevundimonas sp. TaxID=1871086 RepID=UPI001AD50106|nr:fumarylacetoacetate hydrolase family protein [Brevundimonas sp.]MBN9465498.1 fumarylacetoacetate hydrolase family protein [Brevundimonas sp.]